jgi:type IV pilus assembly protein PilA
MYATIRERRSEEGFTLIELLVVMIIIAILMAVAVPTFLAQKNNAQKTKATANIKQIVNAIESCAVNNTDGTYTGTGSTPPGTNCLTDVNLKSFEKGLTSLGTILAASPTNPGQYAVLPNNTQGYSVQSVIQDGDYRVRFAENHLEDGNLAKICSAGTGSAPAIAATATTGAGNPNARTCTNGRWG